MTETRDIFVMRRAAFYLLAAVFAFCAGFMLCGSEIREVLLPDLSGGFTSLREAIGDAAVRFAPLLICFGAVFAASFTPYRVWVCLAVLGCRAVGAGAVIRAAGSGDAGAVCYAASVCAGVVCLLAFCAVCSGKMPDYTDREAVRARRHRVIRAFLSLSGAAVVSAALGMAALHFI